MKQFQHQRLLLPLGLLLAFLFQPFTSPALASTPQVSLSLGSATASTGTTANIGLSLTSATTLPSALQWTFSYSTTDFSAIQATVSSSAANAGKSLFCSGGNGTYTCLLVGANSTSIPVGTLANVSLTVAGSTTPTRVLSVPQVLASSPTGDFLTALATDGTISLPIATPVTVSSLTCSLTSILSGGSASCTVSLSAAAPTGGQLVTLSDNTTALTTPSSVTVPAGATSATFSVSVTSILTNILAVITATANGTSKTASLTLASLPVPSSLSCSPSSISSGGSSTCTVTLSSAAPAGGQLVTLSDNSAALTVPASVTVAAGTTSAVFSATASSVTASTTVILTAAANGTSRTASVTVTALPVPSTLSCSPTSITSGGSSSCTVTLSAAAPAGGVSVALSDNNAALTVPASVTVASGATSAVFSATAASVTANTVVVVTATANGTSRTASVTVTAPLIPSTLSCSPASVTSGSAATCTVTLSIAAPAGGQMVTLSDNSAALITPASVTVTSGATSATFSVTAASVTTNTGVVVTATANGTTKTASLTVAAKPLPSTLSCSPTSLTSGGSASCTVTLSVAAPAGGQLVTLSDNSAALTTPASVTVASGGTSATFSVTAASVTTNTAVVVTATANSTSKTASLTVAALPLPSTLSCSPTSLTSSGSASCTVTLSVAAPAGGQLVTLSDDNKALTTPASVTVAAGATSAAFSVTATSVAVNTAVVITAAANGTSKTTSVTITAQPVPSTLSCLPASITSGGSASCTVTLSAAAPTGGQLVTLSDNNAALTVPASVTVAARTTSATFSAAAGSVTANTAVVVTATANGTSKTASVTVTALPVPSTLSCSPASITSGGSSSCTITLSAAAPAGGQLVTLSDNSAALTTPASVTVTTGATSASFSVTAGSVTANAPVVVTATANGASKTASLTVTGLPVPSILSCLPASIPAGGAASCTITLSVAAPAAGQVVTLTSSNAALTLPATVTVPADTTSAAFAVSASTVVASTAVTVTASANGTAKTSSLTITPQTQVTQVDDVSCAPTLISAGGSSICTVILSTPAKSGGQAVAITVSNSALSVPAWIIVAAGTSTVDFTASVSSSVSQPAQDLPIVLTAAIGSNSKTATVTVTPNLGISSLTCPAFSIASGGRATCTVTLSGPAPPGGKTVTLSDNNTLLTTPASVKVLPGATSASFSLTAGTVTSKQTALVTASLDATSQSVSLSLQPVASSTCPCSVWTSSATPSIGTSTDTVTIELGMKFRSRVSGYVIGVRFYKGPNNTGAHTGRLWSKNGSLLASVTFNGETASGWQQANFSSPVAIAANTTYVVSYQAPKGAYSVTPSYFASSGIESGPLYALKSGDDGKNGSYIYTSGAFPTNTFFDSNYWVDVVFNTVPSTAPGTISLTSEQQAPLTSSKAPASVSTMAAGPALVNTHSDSRLSCSPKLVTAGDSFLCQLTLGDSYSGLEAIPVSASNSDVRLPATLSARTGQHSLSFRGVVDPSASLSSVRITAGDSFSLTSDEISISPSPAPVISLPDRQFVRLGSPIGFTVSAQDGSGLPVALSSSGLPDGAAFLPDSGQFLWTPTSNQTGDSTLSFSATNSAGVTIPGSVSVTVDSGLPLISKPELTACSPGALASIHGRWLTSDDSSDADPSGASLQLSGSLVRINGSVVPLLSASPTRLTFLCPSADPGAQLEITVETEAGDSASLTTTMLEASPVLLPAPDSNPSAEQPEGFITFPDSDRLAIVRDARQLGEPALPGDLVSLRATGLGPIADTPGALRVSIGGIDAAVQSVIPDPNAAGVYLVVVRVPEAAAAGFDVAVQLTLHPAAGDPLASNTVTLAIE